MRPAVVLFALWVVWLVSLVSPAALASAGQPPASLTTTPPPASVLLDAVVVDKGGRPVADLTAADFQVAENGAARALDGVRYLANPPRTFGIFLDEYHVASGAAADAIRTAISRFVERQMRPGDRGLVVKPLDSLVALRLTDDRAGLLQSVATFEGRKGDLTARDTFEQQLMAGDQRRVAATRAQIAVSAMTALASELATAGPGRKTLIVVSEGFVAQPHGRGEEPLPTVETITRVANRGQVSIYAVHPNAWASTPVDTPAVAALQQIAADTQGRVAADAASAESALDQLAREAAGYYVLEFPPAQRDGPSRFHAVDVRTTRKNVEVRARRGYWTPLPGDVQRSRIAAREAAAARPPALPRRTSPLIRPWFGQSRSGDGRTRVRFAWEPARRLPGDRSRVLPPARIGLTVYGADGATVFEGSVRDGDRAEFDVRPGRLRIHMTIEDAAARVLDTDVRDVSIGALTAPVAIGTMEVFRARNALEFRTLVASRAAPPAPGREFSRIERLLVRVPVYAAEPGATVAARLVSRMGTTLRELPAAASPIADTYDIDLPLAGLAAGEYRLDVAVTSPAGEARDLLVFRVTP